MEIINRQLTESETKAYEDLLPYLINKVKKTVVYEYACTDELILAWAKHFFITQYCDLLKKYSATEVKAVLISNVH